MDLTNLPEIVQKLAALGFPDELDEKFKYRDYGVKRSQIPELIQVVQNAGEWMRESDDDEEEDPTFWLPLHAWRSLGELKAADAIPALINTLHLIDTDDNDVVQEDLPHSLAMIGPEALPPLVAFLETCDNGLWSRIAAANAISLIGLQTPAARGKAVETLTRALEDFEAEETIFNSFIIAYLSDLKAIEAAELVEQVFSLRRTEVDIIGDWEDFQVAVGLLEERRTPARSTYFDPFGDQITGQMDFLEGHTREDKKTKKKRKISKETRKKNRKKKK